MNRTMVPPLLALGALLFAALPTVAAYELYSYRWVCRRSGARAGLCYAEPTLRDRLPGSQWSDEYPRTWFMQVVSIADLKEALPGADPGVALVMPDVESCRARGLPPSWYASPWQVPVVMEDAPEPVAAKAAVDAFIADFDDFLRTKTRDTFALHPRVPLHGWRTLWYAAYAIALGMFALALRVVRSGRGRRTAPG